jgi:hypothetical protein
LPSRKRVAERAGVSVGTVSDVTTGPVRVSQRLRQVVQIRESPQSQAQKDVRIGFRVSELLLDRIERVKALSDTVAVRLSANLKVAESSQWLLQRAGVG